MNDIFCLCKLKVSFFAALSAAAGFILFLGRINDRALVVSVGVFFLACGASALNQYQELSTDALMARTRNRPLASGRMAPGKALVIVAALIFSGLVSLYGAFGSTTVILGLCALLLYNGIYTGMKATSAFAAAPGALIGAIPPAMGWAAAGGSLSDPRLLSVSLFFVIWQIPHSWLFLLRYGAEYEEAGLPSLMRALGRERLDRVVFQWISAVAVSGPVLCLFGMGSSAIVQYSLLAASAWLVTRTILFMRGGTAEKPVFSSLDRYVLIVVVLLVSDRILIP
ncbi:MAG TPA: UbiA family prenyltransferase [Dissulfurispiraceae bacterium]|nr:UbiA family prenyltransferase [Dissulfurispiraceae bacterium]